jgi:hypothetical protein
MRTLHYCTNMEEETWHYVTSNALLFKATFGPLSSTVAADPLSMVIVAVFSSIF